MKSLINVIPMLISITLLSCSHQSEESSLKAFIDAHVKTIEPKLKSLNLASWNASATGEQKYYDEQAALELEVRKVYSNKEEYEQIKKWKESGTIQDSLLQRQLIILYNSYVTNQLDTVLMKKIVDLSAEISKKFNTFRAEIGGKTVSDNELDNILRTETNAAKRKAAWEASKEVGKAVAPQVVELVKLRNEAAKKLGFSNYYEMSLQTSEQTVPEILAIFDELKALSDEPFKKLKSEIDGKLAAKYNITADQMHPWHYQDRFFQEAPKVGSIDLDKYIKGKKVEEVARMYYAGLNLPVDDILKNSDLFGREKKYQHAFCTDIDRLGDVRIIESIVDNQYWMSTTLHELGHAVYSKNINPRLPFLLRTESHTFLTEAIAMLNERQSSNADWLERLTGIDPKDKEQIRTVGAENLRMHALIFCRWTQVMMRFEKAMYENPDQDLNTLWWNLVKEYQMISPPEGRNSPDWAAKIHLALYPAYYHNYQLGELTASQLQNYISQNILKQADVKDVCLAGNPEIGQYLKTNIFEPGSSLRWDVLMKNATGSSLSAKSFAREYIQ